jgi:hypothetical protein
MILQRYFAENIIIKYITQATTSPLMVACLNKRIIVTRDNGDVESNSDKLYYEDMPPLEDCSEDELSLPIEKSLVIRCNTLGSG